MKLKNLLKDFIKWEIAIFKLSIMFSFIMIIAGTILVNFIAPLFSKIYKVVEVNDNISLLEMPIYFLISTIGFTLIGSIINIATLFFRQPNTKE